MGICAITNICYMYIYIEYVISTIDGRAAREKAQSHAMNSDLP